MRLQRHGQRDWLGRHRRCHWNRQAPVTRMHHDSDDRGHASHWQAHNVSTIPTRHGTQELPVVASACSIYVQICIRLHVYARTQTRTTTTVPVRDPKITVGMTQPALTPVIARMNAYPMYHVSMCTCTR
jgi:hypothetical protein